MRQIYYKSRQLFIYYKLQQNFITKRVSFFIAKQTRRFYWKMRQLSQNASTLLQIEADFFYYKLRQPFFLLQIVAKFYYKTS